MNRPDIQIVSQRQIASHGTTQIRCVQPAEILRDAGYTVELSAIHQATPIARKLIILHRVALDPYTRLFITCAQARGIPLIYDTDDLLFDADGVDYLSRGAKAKIYADGWKPYSDVMKICDAVTVSTDFLAARARNINPNTYVILNALSTDYLQTATTVAEHAQATAREGVTMAYLSGSGSHNADFATIEDALVKALQTHTDTRLLLVGALAISEKFAGFEDRIVRQDFKPYSEFPHLFDGIDINLIPLEIDHPFCHAKSELKFIEAAACGVVSIAAPTEPHIAAIKHGKNGMLATSGWNNCLDTLIQDSALRKRLGLEARHYVSEYYTPEQRKQIWADVIQFVTTKPKAKSVGRSKYLTSLTMMTYKYWRLTLQTWALKMRKKWLKR